MTETNVVHPEPQMKTVSDGLDALRLRARIQEMVIKCAQVSYQNVTITWA